MPLSFPEVSELSVTLQGSSHRRCIKTKGILSIFAKFRGKHLSKSLFFNNVAGLRLATLLKGGLWYRCFSYKFCKTFKNIYFEEHL